MAFWMLLWAACTTSRPPAVTFAVTGDAPYDKVGDTTELERLRRDVAAVQDVLFVAHVGDLKTGSTPCTAQTYTQVAEVMCNAQVPALVLPGDNEWNDCERTKDQGFDTVEGWKHWDRSFGPGASRCDRLVPPTGWQVKTQSKPNRAWWPGTHSGGFSFDHHGVRFLGLALPSFEAPGHGLPGKKGEVVQRTAMDWLEQGLRSPAREVKAAVVLLHADVLQPRAKQEAFVAALEAAARAWDRPVLVIVGDSHAFTERRPFDGVDLQYVVITRGGVEAPLTVEVRPTARTPFTLIRAAQPPSG